MSDLKTKPTGADVEAFLAAIEDERKQADCREISSLMEDVTGEPAVLWGPSILGFGSYHYRYESGREGDWMLAGFAPRKRELTLYIMAGFDGYEDLMARLGKFKTGKSCLYIKRLDDIDRDVLRELVTASVEHMRATNP